MKIETLQRIYKALSDEQERANEALQYTEESIVRCEEMGMAVTSTLLNNQKRLSSDCDELARAIDDFKAHDWH